MVAPGTTCEERQCSVARAADQDVDGSKDHPMFSRMPNYFIIEYDGGPDAARMRAEAAR